MVPTHLPWLMLLRRRGRSRRLWRQLAAHDELHHGALRVVDVVRPLQLLRRHAHSGRALLQHRELDAAQLVAQRRGCFVARGQRGLLLRRLLLVLRQRVAQLGDLPDLYACNISI